MEGSRRILDQSFRASVNMHRQLAELCRGLFFGERDQATIRCEPSWACAQDQGRLDPGALFAAELSRDVRLDISMATTQHTKLWSTAFWHGASVLVGS